MRGAAVWHSDGVRYMIPEPAVPVVPYAVNEELGLKDKV